MPGEVLRPGLDVRMLFDQLSALPLGHSAPDPELDLVVERIGKALRDHRALAAYDRRPFLGRTGHEEFVGISGATARLGDPCKSALARKRSQQHHHEDILGEMTTPQVSS